MKVPSLFGFIFGLFSAKNNAQGSSATTADVASSLAFTAPASSAPSDTAVNEASSTPAQPVSAEPSGTISVSSGQPGPSIISDPSYGGFPTAGPAPEQPIYNGTPDQGPAPAASEVSTIPTSPQSEAPILPTQPVYTETPAGGVVIGVGAGTGTPLPTVGEPSYGGFPTGSTFTPDGQATPTGDGGGVVVADFSPKPNPKTPEEGGWATSDKPQDPAMAALAVTSQQNTDPLSIHDGQKKDNPDPS